MVDLVKQPMTYIWATSGDIVAPETSKIEAGWAVETVPRQWWNWMQNRVDNNVAYLLQKGFPEWDASTEYIINKSYVQHLNVIYKCIQTHTNQSPDSSPTYWVKAFVVSTAAGEAVGALTPAVNTLPYFTGSSSAATTPFTAFARSLLDDADAETARTTLSAQAANIALTALSGVSLGANKLPYFTGVSTASTTTLTAFARTLLDDVDADTARATLSAQAANVALTAISGVTPAANQLAYFTGASSAALTSLTSFARTLLDDADATAARATLALGSIATQNSNSVSISGGTITGITDLAIADGGTGASDAAGARANLGLGSAAVRAENFFLQSSQNLADLPNDATARANLGLGNSAVRNVGTVAGTVAAGDDTRIVNAVPNSRTITAGNGLTGGGALTSNLTVSLGTPGTLTASTTNATTATSHTHAIDINGFFGSRGLAQFGHYTFPGGFKLIWGIASVAGGDNRSTAVTFHADGFTTECFGVQLTYRQNTDDDGDSCWAFNVTNTGFTLGNDGRGNSVFWFAYGF